MNALEKTEIRILALEDSDIDSELIMHELRQGGIEFTATRVQTGADFERAIFEFKPELILADYRLPTFDGGQALAMAKERCPDVPVIVISGAVGEETAVELLKNGATDFVLKDRLGRLVPAVDRALWEVELRNARRKAEADLRTLNEQLEQRVADRTRELREKNALMEEDLQMARELQMTFLPNQFPTLPRGAAQAASAVKFSSIFHPTSSVSGDYYNVVRVSDTAVGIFICDVMGHGVRAALVTAIMRTLEEQLSDLAGDPGALLTKMNHALRGILGQLGATLFTTACYVVVDVATARLTFANAGHPSPLLLRAATDEVVPITTPNASGPALGLFDDVQYHTQELPVEVGDSLLVFTDGLYKVENSCADAFGVESLREAIQQRAGLPLAKLMQDVFSEIETFAEDEAFPDDVCLVGMEIARLDIHAGKASGTGENGFHAVANGSSRMALAGNR
jgi:sigma-B regulation protein RsbU (phosphoserine phosphatase)